MNNNRRIQKLSQFGLIGLFVITNLASTSFADFFYVVRFDQPSIELMPGQNINVNVLLEESVTGTSQHRIDLSGGMFGLLTGNFGVTKSGAGTSLVSAATGNPLFDLGPTIALGNPTTISQGALINSPLFGSASGIGVRAVSLGTISITGAGNIGDQNLFTLSDFNLASDDFVIDDGFGGLSFVADTSIAFQGLNVTLTAIPEPSSFLTATVAVWILSCRRRRR